MQEISVQPWLKENKADLVDGSVSTEPSTTPSPLCDNAILLELLLLRKNSNLLYSKNSWNSTRRLNGM